MASSGYGATKTSKKYTCEDVDAYIQSIESMSEASATKLKEDAKIYIDAYFAQNNSYISGAEINYAGMYVLMSKEDTWSIIMRYTLSIQQRFFT